MRPVYNLSSMAFFFTRYPTVQSTPGDHICIFTWNLPGIDPGYLRIGKTLEYIAQPVFIGWFSILGDKDNKLALACPNSLIPGFSMIEILWVNLIMAIACAIPLIWEPIEKGLLEKPPRDPKEKLFNALFLQKTGLVSLISAAAAVSLFLYYTNVMADRVDYLTEAQTLAFTTIIMVQLFYLFTARSITESAFTFSPFSNKMVLIGAAATLGFQLLLVYSEPLFGVSPFRTAPFPSEWWIPIILVSILGFLIVELEKLIRRRWGKVTS